jgi:SAM-dependent methyltransferase
MHSVTWRENLASGTRPDNRQASDFMGSEVKKQVREFYDQVGWQTVGQDSGQELHYQNARYEDLRPVAQEYIQRCHMRVARHLAPDGRYLLDAGSGPIQYPEYLEYSKGYRYRVCADISITALKEARMRIGGRGLYVVADIANLPFKAEAFDGVISLHTIHHLPEQEHPLAYQELYRVLMQERSAVVVNGWSSPPLTRLLEAPLRWRKSLRKLRRRISGQSIPAADPDEGERRLRSNSGPLQGEATPKGTFVQKNNAAWLKRTLGQQMALEILVWRSISVRFLRAYIHPRLAGRWWLRRLYGLEERFPHFFGENGQYPLIVIRKS